MSEQNIDERNDHVESLQQLLDECNVAMGNHCQWSELPLRITRLRAVISEWQPIESAPKDGTEIILSWWTLEQISRKRMVTAGRFDKDNGDGEPHFEAWTSCFWDGWDTIPTPTHWQPLPAPPSETTA